MFVDFGEIGMRVCLLLACIDGCIQCFVNKIYSGKRSFLVAEGEPSKER